MYAFIRSLLAELSAPKPKSFRRTSLLDRREAARRDPQKPSAEFGRRGRQEPVQKTKRR